MEVKKEHQNGNESADEHGDVSSQIREKAGKLGIEVTLPLKTLLRILTRTIRDATRMMAPASLSVIYSGNWRTDDRITGGVGNAAVG